MAAHFHDRLHYLYSVDDREKHMYKMSSQI